MRNVEHLSSGLRLHQLVYPGYPWRRPRVREYAALHVSRKRQSAVITHETGNTLGMGLDGGEYAVLRDYAVAYGLTLYCPMSGANTFPWLAEAVADRHAKVLTSQRGILGIAWRVGRRYAGCYSPQTWYRAEADDLTWLRSLRGVANVLGVGSYDTAASMGTATLFRFWQAARLPSVWRCPGDMADLLLRYRVGGRVETPGLGQRFAELFELDIKGAHPAVVANGLPWGQRVYHGRGMEPEPGSAWDAPAIGYGLWRITVHESIAHGPLPVRDWSLEGSRIGWDMEPGTFDYAGWTPEIAALRATGRASAEWLYGWSWSTLSNALAGWVAEMVGHRERMEDAGELELASLVKLCTNAAIGRWGLRPERYRLVPIDDAEPGDAFMQLPEWSYLEPGERRGILGGHTPEPPSMLLRREPDSLDATPWHLSSYVQMAVRMALYERMTAERSAGGTIAMVNFDAVLLTEAPKAGYTDMYRWRVYRREDAYIPYARAIESWMRDLRTGEKVFIRMLPGLAERLRLPEKASEGP